RSVPKVDEVNVDTPYVQIEFPTGTCYVDARQLYAVFADVLYVYGVLPVEGQYLSFTTSLKSIDVTGTYKNYLMEDIDAVSADHCQDDSRKQLYKLVRLE